MEALEDRALPSSFTFIKIAGNSTPLPGFPGQTFQNLFQSTPVIDGTNLAFNGGSFEHSGIYYTTIGGAIKTVADDTTPLPENPSQTFFQLNFPSVSIHGTDVGFANLNRLGQQIGLYARIDGKLQVVANQSTLVPGGGRQTFDQFTDLAISRGRFAFVGTGSSGNLVGLYTSTHGSIQVVADNKTASPNGTGKFVWFYTPVFDGSRILFSSRTTMPGGPFQGPFIYAGSDEHLSAVVDGNTPIPGGSGNFTEAVIPSADRGQLAFYGLPNGGVYLRNPGGRIVTVADQSTPIPGGQGTFSLFDIESVNNRSVLFHAYDSQFNDGLYLYRNGSLSKVIADFDTLNGQTVNGLFMSSESLSGDSLAFGVVFTDNSTAVYAATAPEPGETFLGAVASVAASAPGRQPANYRATIDWAHGATSLSTITAEETSPWTSAFAARESDLVALALSSAADVGQQAMVHQVSSIRHDERALDPRERFFDEAAISQRDPAPMAVRSLLSLAQRLKSPQTNTPSNELSFALLGEPPALSADLG